MPKFDRIDKLLDDSAAPPCAKSLVRVLARLGPPKKMTQEAFEKSADTRALAVLDLVDREPETGVIFLTREAMKLLGG